MTRGMRFTSSFGLVISLTLTSALPKLSLLLDQEKLWWLLHWERIPVWYSNESFPADSGEPKVTRYNSMVYRNNHTPTWGELMKLDISSETIEISQSDKPFAFSYLPLFSANRTFIPDGEHNLILFIYDEQSATPEVYSRVRPTFVPGQLIPGVTLALSKLLILSRTVLSSDRSCAQLYIRKMKSYLG
ncbi:hypothetical protein KEM48_006194 [Puccinia striiformis f. sp. tritici PST-130]|nr:hypothetical protein KEM48_006194 [Puccinia striiformis f. sp. tritici PST-130]